MIRNNPIRTYQRKNTKKSKINNSLFAPPYVPPPVLLSGKYSTDCEYNRLDKSGTCNDSISDPFETTFDRIAKGAVVPPLALDTNQIDSWNSSSDNNISNVVNLVKSPKYEVVDRLTYKSIEVMCKHEKPQKSKLEVVTKKILPKRTKISLENKLRSKTKAQVQKKQTNKVQKKKKYKFKKLNCICNEEIFYSDIKSNLNDVLHKNDILCNCNKNILKNENITKTSRTILDQVNNSITNFKCTSDNYETIKSCFVKLDAHAIQKWYILNHEKIIRNRKGNIHDMKISCINTSKTNENNTGIHKASSQPISINCIGTSKHMPIKPCSVICNSIVEDLSVSKNKTNINSSINAKDKLNIPITLHDVSESAFPCNTYSDITVSDTKKYNYRENQIKYSFVKVERLDMELIKEKNKIFNIKEQNMVSSTPISKHARCSTYSMLLSPIDNNIHNKLDLTYESSTAIIKENNSINVLPDKCKERKNPHSLSISECCQIDVKNVQEQQKVLVSSSQKLPIAADSAVKTKAIVSNIDILMQKYNTEHDMETGSLYSLNVSASTNQSRSLFDDTTHHSAEDAAGINTEKKYFRDMVEYESAKADVSLPAHLPAHLDLKQKQLLNDNVHIINSKYVLPSETHDSIEILEDLNNIIYTRQRFKNQIKQNINTRTLYENSKNKAINNSKHDFISKSQDNINIIDNVLLKQLQDPNRITERRTQYSKWNANILNMSHSFNRSMVSNNKVLNYDSIDECSVSSRCNFEHALTNPPFENFKLLNDVTQQHNNDIKVQEEKSVFLKPGKYWARSLSILNNINTESNLDKLSVGKGKKWRHSVRDILNMQKQETFQSCLKKDEDDLNLFRREFDTLNVSSFGSNKCKVSESVTYARFSKRASVRVVPNNNTSIKYDVEDTLFLEAFGITAENSHSSIKVLDKELPIHDIQCNNNTRINKTHLTTAKDVVLQKCSQKYYLPFSEYFSDAYLEYCCKIGEGVYGEVFLYEYDDKKSVIKIIPIEGEELVNSEPQKKFNEILSEIVIAKELHNLRLHTAYRTSGFIEVKNIKCIIGKYPERLIELWNNYDNDKTSDNDCPSMFGENQLYIALELNHGGEDLEAFVFQTAEETYALFLQIALTLAVAEKACEFEHRDLHWGNILISRTKELYIYYNFGEKEIKFPSNGVKVSIIDFTLSRMLYQECCIYNDLALDPALFTAYGEYQFEIYRLMRNKIQNNWRKFEPYTNILWLHYILDKMITAVRYKRKNLKVHKHTIIKLKEFKDIILKYNSAFDFVMNNNSIAYLLSGQT